MIKKALICSMLLALTLTSAVSLGSGMSSAKTSADFTDLKDLDAVTKAKFDAMISAGIFDSVSEDTFGLGDNMNRAQFAKVAALMFNLNVDRDLKKSSFTDVKSDDPAIGYALPYIEAVKRAGITEGTGEGIFNPAGKVTKEQLATFLVRGLGKDSEAKQASGVDDPTVSDWARGYVGMALGLGLLNNDLQGEFSGRGEADLELITNGSYESAKTIENTTPIEVSGAEFLAGNKLNLTLSVRVNTNSIDLSKITINGVPLDPKLDSFALSEDKKTIIITLHNGFQLDTSRAPVINTNGLKTIFGNEVKNEEGKQIPVTVTVAPVTKPEPTYTPSTPQPTASPSPSQEPNPSPSQGPNPNTGSESDD